MASHGRHGLNIPSDTDADMVPLDFAEYSDSLADRIIGTALTTAERDTKHAEAPVGALVNVALQYYIKTGTGPSDWAAIMNPKPIMLSYTGTGGLSNTFPLGALGTAIHRYSRAGDLVTGSLTVRRVSAAAATSGFFLSMDLPVPITGGGSRWQESAGYGLANLAAVTPLILSGNSFATMGISDARTGSRLHSTSTSYTGNDFFQINYMYWV